MFHPQLYADPTRDSNNKGNWFYLLFFESIGYLHCYRFHQSGFKITPIVLLCTTMQGLVEDVMCVSQGYILVFGGDV